MPISLMTSDKDEAVFNRRVQTALGIRDSEVRDLYLKKREKEATQDADRKNSDEYRERKAKTHSAIAKKSTKIKSVTYCCWRAVRAVTEC
jgi:hypothetical protein